jgi:hypothetical protein
MINRLTNNLHSEVQFLEIVYSDYADNSNTNWLSKKSEWLE